MYEKLLNTRNKRQWEVIAQKVFNYVRMSESTFNYLRIHLTNSIKKQDTHFRIAVGPKEMLVVTLRYLASGCSLTDLHKNYRLGISTLSEIINFVCQKIWEIFRSKYLENMSKQKWKIVAEGFKKRASFSNCFGAIDGKHIRIKNLHRMLHQQIHFWKLLMQQNLHIPQPTPMTEGRLTVPYVFVADNAFPMNEHVLRSLFGHNLSQKQRV